MRALIALCAVLMLAGPAQAEVSEVIIAQQYGVAMLPLMVMERMGFAEKQAKAAGLPPLSVQFRQVAGPSVMNDGLISGALQFGALGAPSLITLWDRTRSNVGVMGVAAITTYPLFLITRNPAVKVPQDFTAADKIAVPSVKISTQAIMLQMLAASLYGDKDYQHFDPLTVSLSHPDAAQALISGTAGVDAHFSSSPFYEQEMKTPGMHVLTTNYAILGGPATALVLAASRKFHDANPKTFRAVYAGLAEAIEWINADKRRAAALYIEMAKDTKNSVDDILHVIADPDYAYTLRPSKVFATASFMAKVGSIRKAPVAIGDMFFADGPGQKGD